MVEFLNVSRQFEIRPSAALKWSIVLQHGGRHLGDAGVDNLRKGGDERDTRGRNPETPMKRTVGQERRSKPRPQGHYSAVMLFEGGRAVELSGGIGFLSAWTWGLRRNVPLANGTRIGPRSRKAFRLPSSIHGAVGTSSLAGAQQSSCATCGPKLQLQIGTCQVSSMKQPLDASQGCSKPSLSHLGQKASDTGALCVFQMHVKADMVL
jgi:hypothetical protein